MKKHMYQQYNKFAKEFVVGTEIHNGTSREEYYKALEGIVLKDKKVLDIGCGDGYDLLQYSSQNPLE